MVDYQSSKVPIFTGINDAPILPTATTGGNISHFYNLFNTLVDLLEADITVIETAANVDYSTDITALQNSISTLQTDTTANSNSLTTNGVLINTNATDIDNLETSVGDLQTNITNLDTRVTDTETNITTLTSSLGGVTETFANNTIIYLDLNAGNDSNDGLTNTTPILTISKLKSILESKFLPNELEIKVTGTIAETLDFSRLTYLLDKTIDNAYPTLKISTGDTVNFKIEHDRQLLISNNSFPLKIIFTECDFKATGAPIFLIGCNSKIIFLPPCNFDSDATNNQSIFYFQEVETFFSTFGNDLIFNNSNAASLECAIRVNDGTIKTERVTVNDIDTFVILEDGSFGENTINSMVLTNVTTTFDLRKNSFLRSDRYNSFAEPTVILDGSSSVNNMQEFSKTLINPPLNQNIKLINNARRDYHIKTKGYSGFFTDLVVNYSVDSGDLATQGYKISKGEDLIVSFAGSTEVQNIVLGLELYDYVED